MEFWYHSVRLSHVAALNEAMLHEMLNFIVWSVRLLAPLKNTAVKFSSDKEAADFFFPFSCQY